MRQVLPGPYHSHARPDCSAGLPRTRASSTDATDFSGKAESVWVMKSGSCHVRRCPAGAAACCPAACCVCWACCGCSHACWAAGGGLGERAGGGDCACRIATGLGLRLEGRKLGRRTGAAPLPPCSAGTGAGLAEAARLRSINAACSADRPAVGATAGLALGVGGGLMEAARLRCTNSACSGDRPAGAGAAATAGGGLGVACRLVGRGLTVGCRLDGRGLLLRGRRAAAGAGLADAARLRSMN